VLYDTDEIGEKTSDYVVSSYTPTLTAILETSEPAVEEDFQVLTVAQGWAPGAPPIPKTEDEVRIVHRLTTGVRIVNLMKEDATVDRVREEMMESNWVHLACHGQQNPEDPMESGFLLHDKTLKLSEIVKMSLPKADFAFLSACQMAMGDERVAEESVHLAAGMFLSGCRGVIATTWSIRDDDAPKIAEDVYSRIFKDGKPNRKEAAYALHEAVKRLRESGANARPGYRSFILDDDLCI
jgi:CHAT domain-containing protein